MTGGYYRNWYGNFLVTDNTLVTPADFSPYCVTAPHGFTPARRRRLSRSAACTTSCRRSSARSTASCLTDVGYFGKQMQVNDFFNVNINARLNSGLQVGGGVDTGRTVNDVCFNVDSPGAVAANAGGTGLLPGVSATPTPVYGHDGERPGSVQSRHAVQRSDAGEGLRELHVPERHRRERHLPEHLGAAHHFELRGAQLGDRPVARPQPGSLRYQKSVHEHGLGSVDGPSVAVRRPVTRLDLR